MTAAATRGASADSSNLDVLRAIAVLLVLLDHVLEMTGDKLNRVFHPYDWYCGRLGVLLFFVHTSLVLMYSLERMHASGPRLIQRFYLRRLFRIYPLSIVTVLLVVLLRVPSLPWREFTWMGLPNLASNLALTMNLTYSRPVLSPLWSLPLEVQMYVVLPFAYLLVRPRGVRMALGLWVVAVLCALVQPHVIGRLSVAEFGPCFMGGVIAWALQRRLAPRLPSALWPFVVLAMVGIYVLAEQVSPGMHPPPLAWGLGLGLGLAIPLFHNIPAGTLQRASHLVAKYSYGIYLMHCVALWAGFYLLVGAHPVLQSVVFAVLLVSLSVGSYHLLEEPFMQYGRRLSDGGDAMRPGTAAR